MRVGLDCRYIRERPSGIGTYVQALVDRLPALGPSDRFVFWAHTLAPGPLSSAPNVTETTVAIEPNSPLTMLWPRRYFALDGLDEGRVQAILLVERLVALLVRLRTLGLVR